MRIHFAPFADCTPNLWKWPKKNERALPAVPATFRNSAYRCLKFLTFYQYKRWDLVLDPKEAKMYERLTDTDTRHCFKERIETFIVGPITFWIIEMK